MNDDANFIEELRSLSEHDGTQIVPEDLLPLSKSWERLRQILQTSVPPDDLKDWLFVHSKGGDSWHELVDTCSIGASSSCEISVDSPYISRRHAKLTRVAKDWKIDDLESHNGIILDHEKVTSHWLRAGDICQLADVVIVFFPRLDPDL